jgi:hypothetical protein
MAWKDDGSETLTIYLRSNDHEEMVVIPPEMRELVAYEGWSKFVDFEPGFRRGE